jgi:hypothetical protein
MFKSTQLLLLVLAYNALSAQSRFPLALTPHPGNIDPSDYIELFDKKEIQSRKIDTAYVIYHSQSWPDASFQLAPKPDCFFSDTLERYVFDKNGWIKERSNFPRLSESEERQIYDSTGKIIFLIRVRKDKSGSMREFVHDLRTQDTSFVKVHSYSTIERKDSLSFSVVLYRLKKGMDTVAIYEVRYDEKRRKTEERRALNKRNQAEYADCVEGENFHYKYGYNEFGKLCLYDDLTSAYYDTLIYAGDMRIIRTIKKEDNSIYSEALTRISRHARQVVVANDLSQIVFTFLNERSKLVGLRSEITLSDVPSVQYYEVIYRSGGKDVRLPL